MVAVLNYSPVSIAHVNSQEHGPESRAARQPDRWAVVCYARMNNDRFVRACGHGRLADFNSRLQTRSIATIGHPEHSLVQKKCSLIGEEVTHRSCIPLP